MGKILLLCDTPDQNQDVYDLVLYWNSFEESYNSISLPKVIENNSNALKHKYLTWLYGFGRTRIDNLSIVEHLLIRKDFSFWWTSLLVEKSIWKSPGLYKAFQLLAFDLSLRDYDINRVDIKVTDKLVQKTIKQWCNEHRVKYRIVPTVKEFQLLTVRQLYAQSPYIIQGIVSFFRYLVSHWTLKKIWKSYSVIPTNGVTFISYLFNLDKESANKAKFYSRYWTSLHDLLSINKVGVNWLHIFVKNDMLPTVKKAEKLINRFNRNEAENQMHMLLDSGMNWGVTKGVIADYCRLVFKGIKLGKVKQHFTVADSVSSINLWYVLRNDWKCSVFGKTAISNCLFLNLFENALNSLPKQKKGFYLLENQAWERCLIYAWKKAGHGQIIGVPHTVISPWDLRHFFSQSEYDDKFNFKLPIPDKVALNGRAAVKAYVNGGFPEERIVRVEALRYLYLSQNKNKYNHNESKPSMLRLLVLGDYLINDTRRQLNLLMLAADKLPSNLDILFKAHPYCPIDPTEWTNINMKIVDDSLDNLIDQYDIAYTSNITTAALEAYLSGKRVLTIVNPDSFNLSSLCGFPGVEFVSTPEELVKQLFVKEDIHVQGSCNDFFYSDANLPLWKKLLQI